MPRFIDHHPTSANLPPEVVTVIRQRLRSGEPDGYGERGINVFIGPTETYCYSEAPSVEAVCKSHEALGVHLRPEDITEVQVLP
jgi:hypothetical protein